MPRRKRELSAFGLSFLDVLANTVGGLAFLLILTVMMIGSVVPQTQPPLITTEALPDAVSGQPYTAWLAAREGLGKFRWSISDGDLPPGLELDPQSGKVFGVVDPQSVDPTRSIVAVEVTCAVEATNGAAALADTRRLSLSVRNTGPSTVSPLRILTGPLLPEAYAGRPYPLVLAAEGGLPPYQWQLAGSSGPAGLSIDRNGRFQGTPAAPGQYPFRISVRASDGQVQVASLTLAVETKYPAPKTPPPLKIVTQQLPEAVAARPFAVFLAAEGGVPPYTWRVGEAPAWLINAGGVPALFAGTPAVGDVGTRKLVWTVSDREGQSATTTALELRVLPPTLTTALPLQLRTKTLPSAHVGEPYHVPVSAQGGVPPYRWEIDQPIADWGIEFATGDDAADPRAADRSTLRGVFAGTPTSPGILRRTVAVIDSAGERRRQSLVLRIRPATVSLASLTTTAGDGRVERAYHLALAATGGYPPYQWKQVGGELPPGLRLEEGQIHGAPSVPGAWDASFELSDADGKVLDQPIPLHFPILTPQGHTKLLVTTKRIPTLSRNDSMELAFACEGGQPPYVWEMLEQAPPGLSFRSSTLVGSPHSAGTFQTKFRVHDQEGQTVEQVMPVTVRSLLPAWLVYVAVAILLAALIVAFWFARGYYARQPKPLTIQSRTIPNARASCQYEVHLACVGGTAPYRWTLANGELPPGLVLHPDGRLAGIPLESVSVQQTLDYPFCVRVTDARGIHSQQQL